MDGDSQTEREVRAARNQSVFRAVNEKLLDLNRAFADATNTFVIACECADMSCLETLELAAAAYEDVRREPNRFAVLPGHVYPEVEVVVAEAEGYVIVEKISAAADVAAILDPRSE
jgi:hypothetical protein